MTFSNVSGLRSRGIAISWSPRVPREPAVSVRRSSKYKQAERYIKRERDLSFGQVFINAGGRRVWWQW